MPAPRGARNIELTVALSQLFTQPVTRVESLVAPEPEPEKQKMTMRVRVHFEDGKSAVVEARLTQDDLGGPTAPMVQPSPGGLRWKRLNGLRV